MVKKICVLSSGGDAPGMNACIRAIVRTCERFGIKVYGAASGYQGLIDGAITELSLSDVENIIGLGGTILKTSRCSEFMTEAGFNKAIKFLKSKKFDGLIVLGGDGSLRGAERLSIEGINVVGIPCTIDNDLNYTDFTIGFDTAINTVTELLGSVRDTSSSHDRVCVVEVMGRYSGEIALYSGLASGAEVILTPEVKLGTEEIAKKILTSVKKGEKSVLVVVAEGVASAEEIASQIKISTNIDAKSMSLGYVQRGGSPTVNDRVLATRFGVAAVEAVNSGNFGIALGVKNGTIKAWELSSIHNEKSKFDKKLLKTNDMLSV